MIHNLKVVWQRRSMTPKAGAYSSSSSRLFTSLKSYLAVGILVSLQSFNAYAGSDDSGSTVSKLMPQNAGSTTQARASDETAVPGTQGVETESTEHQQIDVLEVPSPQESRIDRRVEAERVTANNPYVITPHRPNYVLPAKYTTRANPSAFESTPEVDDIDDLELKLQFSFKYPLSTDLFGSNHSLWVAYTQQSYWQAYNSDNSRPFRETNYEPEVFVTFDVDEFSFLGVNPKFINLSLNHQSNGRSKPTSRSWNRVTAEFIFEYDNLAFSFRPWWRIPDSEDDDDNPSIHRYLGYGDLNFVYNWDEYSIDVMLRNNLRTSDNRGAVRVGFTFPLWSRFKGYVQYFNGYGESLVDYNHHTQSLGVGIVLTNWL